MDIAKISLILKISFTLYLVLLVPVYWKNYGWQNFLWFSDVGLFLTLFALWLESPLLISMVAIGVLPFEIIWIIDFLIQLISGYQLIGIADYMFEAQYSTFLKSLSLFHLVIPFIWLGYLFHWGYDPHAFFYQSLLTGIILILTFLLTNPTENINWVFLPDMYHWTYISSFQWLFIQIIGFPLLIFYPLHLAYAWFIKI